MKIVRNLLKCLFKNCRMEQLEKVSLNVLNIQLYKRITLQFSFMLSVLGGPTFGSRSLEDFLLEDFLSLRSGEVVPTQWLFSQISPREGATRMDWQKRGQSNFSKTIQLVVWFYHECINVGILGIWRHFIVTNPCHFSIHSIDSLLNLPFLIM